MDKPVQCSECKYYLDNKCHLYPPTPMIIGENLVGVRVRLGPNDGCFKGKPRD